jgi:hypothetical protein
MPTKKRTPAGYERQKEYIRNWQVRNKARVATRARSQRQTLRLAALAYYGGIPPRCFCCFNGFTDHLTVAAMDGEILFGTTGRTGTALYRKLAREDYPEGYRVLCWNCLMSRSLYHACPHEAEASYAPDRLLLEARVEDGSADVRSADALLAHA